LLDRKTCGPFIIRIWGSYKIYRCQSPRERSIGDIELPAVGAIVLGCRFRLNSAVCFATITTFVSLGSRKEWEAQGWKPLSCFTSYFSFWKKSQMQVCRYRCRCWSEGFLSVEQETVVELAPEVSLNGVQPGGCKFFIVRPRKGGVICRQ
jgi:hypothetical protein